MSKYNQSCNQSSKVVLDACTIGGARPHRGPIPLAEYDSAWPEIFTREAEIICRALGSLLVRIEHVGSTSVSSLAAKPNIDIVLEVADARDEASYVTPLLPHGYELRIREPDWHEHRMLKGRSETVNLHVFSVGCPEVEKMLRFRDHLRNHESDRQRYEAAKRELAARDWEYVQDYADAKSAIIEEINRRAAGVDRCQFLGAQIF